MLEHDNEYRASDAPKVSGGDERDAGEQKLPCDLRGEQFPGEGSEDEVEDGAGSEGAASGSEQDKGVAAEDEAPGAEKPLVGIVVDTTEHRRQKQLGRLNWLAEPCVDLRSGETDTGKADVLVVGLEPDNAEQRLEDLQQYRDDQGQAVIIILLGIGITPSQMRWASEITPYCLSADLTPEALANCVNDLADLWVNRLKSSTQDPRSIRKVVIRVGEGMEIDSILIGMGDAVRNFLSLLSHRKNAQLSKNEEISVGNKNVLARECRRRLGKVIGTELAGLLIDSGGRGGFYRLRQPEEVTALCRESPDAHIWTELQIRRPSLQY